MIIFVNHSIYIFALFGIFGTSI